MQTNSELYDLIMTRKAGSQRRKALTTLAARAASRLGYWPRTRKEIFLSLDLIEPSTF